MRRLNPPLRAVCFDWGGTLMADEGPEGVPMALWPEVKLIEGARECLAAMPSELSLCIATNAADSSREMIEMALERGGLLGFIDHVFCFKELGFSKRQPEFWHAVAERLGLAPQQIVMVGDALEYDVLVPSSLGVQAVWFNPDGATPPGAESVPTVSRLEDFAGLVSEAR